MNAYEEIWAERMRQVAKGRDARHDDARNAPQRYGCVRDLLDSYPTAGDSWRELWVKVGSVAVSVIQSISRREGSPDLALGDPRDCCCAAIMAADPARHFRDCPRRAMYPGAKALGIADQPPPAPSSGPAIWPLVIADVANDLRGEAALGLVLADMRQRDAVGRERYGAPLRAGNGRDPLVDAYQEALDLCAYLRQAIEEGIPDVERHYRAALALVFSLRYPILVRAGSRGTTARDAAHAVAVTDELEELGRAVQAFVAEPAAPLPARARALADELATWAAAHPDAGEVLWGLGRSSALLREAAQAIGRQHGEIAMLRELRRTEATNVAGEEVPRG